MGVEREPVAGHLLDDVPVPLSAVMYAPKDFGFSGDGEVHVKLLEKRGGMFEFVPAFLGKQDIFVFLLYSDEVALDLHAGRAS